MSWTDVGVNDVDVKGCAMRRSLSPARLVARWCLVVPVAGVVVASMEGVPTRHVVVETSPCPVVGEIPVEAVVSPVVPVVEASFNWCPVLPVNDLLEDKIKVHVAGVPLSSIRIDCRLVVPFGCDVV